MSYSADGYSGVAWSASGSVVPDLADEAGEETLGVALSFVCEAELVMSGDGPHKVGLGFSCEAEYLIGGNANYSLPSAWIAEQPKTSGGWAPESPVQGV